MRVTMLGCGTSGGVPGIDGGWGDCDPDEPRNFRRRASIHVQSENASIIVDTTPDLRAQCLDAGVRRLDAVLYTHAHADHIMGIDDLRGFMLRQGRRVPAYGEPRTMDELRLRFDYIFQGEDGYPAICEARYIDGPVHINDLQVTSFRQTHGDIESLGFRFNSIAYSTDFNALPEAAIQQLQGLDVWIVDALGPDPHPTHSHLGRTLQLIERVRPKRAILTHMNRRMDYRKLLAELPAGVEPGYDGMVIELPD